MNNKGLIITIISLVAVIVVMFSYTLDLLNELERYEKIMITFNIDEFIKYPELYTDDYIDQVKVHNCMQFIYPES